MISKSDMNQFWDDSPGCKRSFLWGRLVRSLEFIITIIHRICPAMSSLSIKKKVDEAKPILNALPDSLQSPGPWPTTIRCPRGSQRTAPDQTGGWKRALVVKQWAMGHGALLKDHPTTQNWLVSGIITQHGAVKRDYLNFPLLDHSLVPEQYPPKAPSLFSIAWTVLRPKSSSNTKLAEFVEIDQNKLLRIGWKTNPYDFAFRAKPKSLIKIHAWRIINNSRHQSLCFPVLSHGP